MLGFAPLGSAPLGGLPQEFRAQFELPMDVETSIVRVSSLVDAALVRQFYENPHRLRSMDRRGFEQLIAELFSGFGYQVELTQQTRDGGKDIVAVRSAEVDVRYLIECKRPDEGNVVGVRPVRELLGVKVAERATKAILATTSYFSRDAKLLFEQNQWDLEGRDYDGVRGWLERYVLGKARHSGGER